jgi:hypothetical protein
MTAPVKVVYVLGTQRGGTTVTGRLLGAMAGFAFVGELRRLWGVGPDGDRRCGCGARHRQCPVWSVVLPAVVDEGPPLEEVRRWQALLSSHRASSLTPWPLHDRPGALADAGRGYGELLRSTYRSLADATGARVIVDSSKLPAEARVILGLADVEATLVHVVRDPRATASSLIRRSGRPAGLLGAHPRETLSGSAGWLVRHAASSAVRHTTLARRSMVVRYESVATDPDGFLRSVAQLVGEPVPADAVVVDRAFEAGPDHTPTGAGRFARARVELVRDDRWKADLTAADRLLATAVTAPLAGAYGYRPWQR